MVKTLAYGLFVIGIALGVVAGFVLFAAFSDWRGRGCPGAAQCSDAVGVMVLTVCALVAAAVMIFAAVVFARR